MLLIIQKLGIRVGHYVFETDTDTNGATNPRWDKSFTWYEENLLFISFSTNSVVFLSLF
jgi:hypothetical protein